MDGPEPFRRYRATRFDPIKQPERSREQDWRRLTRAQQDAVADVLDGLEVTKRDDERVLTFLRRWHG